MFNINNTVWKVNYVSPNYSYLMRSDGSYALGACDNDTKTIYINQTLSQPLSKRVLCHEITHAAMFSYDTNLTLEQEELLADLIATYGEEIITITNEVFKRLKGNVQ